MLALILSSVLVLGFVGISESFASNSNSDEKPVYLIKSQNPVLQNLYGVRHNFDVGFTTHLNDHQVAGLERAGFEIESVPLYQLTPPCSPMPDCKKGGGDGGDDGSSGGTRIGEPSLGRIPWGINMVYKNTLTTVEPASLPNGGAPRIVAVLDSGADTNHPDLSITQCKDFTKGQKIKNSCNDADGHGTHVIGTISANGAADDLGIFGVSPDVDIFAYKVCGGSGCWTDDIAAAIDHARQQGAHIVSMSLGGDRESSLISGAINRSPDILFVAAAGNDNENGKLGTIDWPAAHPDVIAVAAIDSNENVASFSSRGINLGDSINGERLVELAAPGVDVESTCTGSFDGAYFDLDGIINGYCIISGTSMATPHVSALAAKLWQGSDDLTRAHLQSVAKDISAPDYDPATGYGLPQIP